MTGPILIQGAMDVETDWLAAQLRPVVETEEGGCRFWRGMAGDMELVVSRTGIGTIRAAAATALGIRRFAPVVVINQGLAGAHREDLHRGDIVVGESCIPIHDLVTPRRGRGEGSDPFTWELHDHREGEGPLWFQAAPIWVKRFQLAPYAGGRKVTGRLGSGDVFNREYDRIRFLAEREDHLCEDMESVAAFQICRDFGVLCVGVRIISNNELTGEPYRREVGLDLQRFVWEALTK